jgi:Holliday junction resolvase RusA-like endonuclease
VSGFDAAWLEQHTREKGVRATVQAGAGVLRPRPAPPIEVGADPFAPVDLSAGITLVLPYPLSGNRYKGERVVPKTKDRPAFTQKYLTAEAKEYVAEVQRRALMQGMRRPYPRRVQVDYQLYPARPQDWEKRSAADPLYWDDDVRCVDGDNAQKLLQDSLQGIAYSNDKMIWKYSMERMEPDAHGARIVVKITPIVRADPRGKLF